MLGLFRKRRRETAEGRNLPDGERIYAIGDIHGCLTELDALLVQVRQDLAGFSGRVTLVSVGDLIDRGPDSAGVIERWMRPPSFADHTHVLMGNHEEAMLGVYDGSGDARSWLGFGGLQTLQSYGIDPAEQFVRGFDPVLRMRAAIPAAHIDFLRSLPDQVRIGDFLFAHAGIRPGVALDEQQAADLRWIRNDFLTSEADHGVTVVHGHTIAPTPQSRANRIGIDTGCYTGGPLTALVLEGTSRRFLQVEGYTG